jgi:predicted DNA-binding protein (UPF0251 family)
MPRPPQPRRIHRPSGVAGFRPIGRPLWSVPTVTLALDGLEALRLADVEGLYQEAAAEQMGVSRATFARILTHARSVVADALTTGKVLLIADEGRAVIGPEEPLPCPLHWGGRRRGRGCRCRGREHDSPGDPGGSEQQGSQEP